MITRNSKRTCSGRGQIFLGLWVQEVLKMLQRRYTWDEEITKEGTEIQLKHPHRSQQKQQSFRAQVFSSLAWGCTSGCAQPSALTGKGADLGPTPHTCHWRSSWQAPHKFATQFHSLCMSPTGHLPIPSEKAALAWKGCSGNRVEPSSSDWLHQLPLQQHKTEEKQKQPAPGKKSSTTKMAWQDQQGSVLWVATAGSQDYWGWRNLYSCAPGSSIHQHLAQPLDCWEYHSSK